MDVAWDPLSPAFPKILNQENWEPSVPLPKNGDVPKIGTLSIPLSELAESATPDTLSPPSGFP